MASDSLSEMRAEYISSMGPDLGPVFFALHHEMINLNVVWQQYVQLFGDSAETVSVLNKTAGLFFKVVQDELWDSVLLRIATLTDPSEMRGNKNITLRALPALIPDLSIRSELENLCDLALTEAEYAREHRNKRIAHKDHDYHIEKGAIPLSGISRKKVENMLTAIRNVLRFVQHKVRDVDFLYDQFFDESGARLLVSKIKNIG